MQLGFVGISRDGTTVFGSGSPLLRLDWTGSVLAVVPDSTIFQSGFETRGLSGDGSVAVGSSYHFTTGRRPALWEAGVVEELLPENGDALSVSTDGTVIVGHTDIGLLWVDGAATPLGQLDGEDLYGTAVSGDRRVVVGSVSGPEAFRWEDGQAVRLGSVPGAYKVLSVGEATSDDGSVITGYLLSTNGYEAYRYAGGTFELLGDLPGGIFESIALAISADGSVIVGRAYPEGNYTSFVWEQDHGMLSLDSLLRHGYGLDPTSLNGSDATGISGDGQIVVGRISPASGGELYIAAIPRSCNDGLDNDGDGLSDFPDDPGCTSLDDRFEIAASLPCDDARDQDGDGLTDFPDDPGCAGPASATESPACDDDVDNDLDGSLDWDGGSGGAAPDPQCAGVPWANHERRRACGLGFELLILAPLLWGRRRSARSPAPFRLR